MAKRKTLPRRARKSAFVISVPEKETYTRQDMEALHMRIAELCIKLSSASAPLYTTVQITHEILTVSVRERKRDLVLRIYGFNMTFCRRLFTDTRDVKLMSWSAALQDLVDFLKQRLLKEKEELEIRARRFGKLADALAVA